MSTSEEDFAKIGLTSDEWKALILGKGKISPGRLDAARAAVATIGKYSSKQAADTAVTDLALRMIGTRYPHLWLGSESLSHDDKIRFIQAKEGCSREEAENQLQQVRKDKDDAKIRGKRK